MARVYSNESVQEQERGVNWGAVTAVGGAAVLAAGIAWGVRRGKINLGAVRDFLHRRRFRRTGPGTTIDADFRVVDDLAPNFADDIPMLSAVTQTRQKYLHQASRLRGKRPNRHYAVKRPIPGMSPQESFKKHLMDYMERYHDIPSDTVLNRWWNDLGVTSEPLDTPPLRLRIKDNPTTGTTWRLINNRRRMDVQRS